MLGINLRLADASDFAGPMAKFVSVNYSQDQAKDVQKSIAEFHEERHKLAQLFTKSDAALETTIQSSLRYLSRLVIISSHFPFGLSDSQGTSFLSRMISNKMTVVPVPFVWNDAFRPTGKLTSYHLTFERASVVFNIAALCSRVGVNKKAAKDDSSLREAQAQFLAAAGVYDWMTHSADVTASSLTSPDFHVDLITMLKFLMLAQAQACYFELATANASKISPATISKLAMGTAELYRSAYNYADKSNVKSMFTQYKWHHHIYFQLMAYQAAASYWQAKSLLKDEKYGDELAQLNRALLCLSNARAVETGLVHTVIEHRSKLENEIKVRHAAATKDNESIYYAVVPKPETVKDPDSIVKVQLTPFNPPTSSDLPDPFSCLVPNVFREANAAFKTKLTSLIQTASRKHREKEENIRTLLASLNLPAAIETSSDAKSESSSPLPDATWNSLRECQAAGGVKALEELSRQVGACAQEAQSGHTKLVETLVKERTEDNDMRTKFGTRWNRRPSEQLTPALVMETDAIGKFLQEASMSNGKLFIDLQNNQKTLDFLNRSRAEIEAKFPPVLPPVPTEMDDSITAMEVDIKQKLSDLNTIMADANKELEKWTAETQRADIVSLLVQGLGSNPKNIADANASAAASSSSTTTFSPATSSSGGPVSVDRISISEYQRYELQLKDFDTLYEKYDSSFSLIHASFDKWQAARKSRSGDADKSRSERQALLQEIHAGVATFHRLQRHFNEGLTFYADLESQKIRPLKQRLADFVFARDEEKKMLLEQLTHQSAAPSAVPVAQPAFNAGSPYPTFTPSPAAPPASAPASAAPMPAFNPYAAVAANPNLSADRPSQPFYSQLGSSAPTGPSLSAPATSSGSNEWTCSQCTFINPIRVAKCEMCAAAKA